MNKRVELGSFPLVRLLSNLMVYSLISMFFLCVLESAESKPPDPLNWLEKKGEEVTIDVRKITTGTNYPLYFDGGVFYRPDKAAYNVYPTPKFYGMYGGDIPTYSDTVLLDNTATPNRSLKAWFKREFYDVQRELYARKLGQNGSPKKMKMTRDELKLIDRYTLMKITDRMKSEDGILEGFILPRQEAGRFNFYIFIDEDWRKRFGDKNINIVWGNNFSDEKAMRVRRYNFTKSKHGVYVDLISAEGLDFTNLDEWDSFANKGGIAVGKITISDIVSSGDTTCVILR